MDNPMILVRSQWLRACESGEPAARHCALATVDEQGHPAVRTLNVQDITEDAVLLFTSTTSPKWRQLRHNPAYEILIFWPTLMYQYRLGGDNIQEMPTPEMERRWREKNYDAKILDILYSSRAQSTAVASRRALWDQVRDLKARYPEAESPPFPAHMKGIYFRINYVEQWVVSPADQLHERTRYHLHQSEWCREALIP